MTTHMAAMRDAVGLLCKHIQQKEQHWRRKEKGEGDAETCRMRELEED